MQIIFLTSYREYAFDAFQLEACAYLQKPYNTDDIRHAIQRAGMFYEKNGSKRISIQTFGRFEVFVNGRPVPFASAKCKELLALIVDRNGAIVTVEDMLNYLWYDKTDSETDRSLCRKVVQRLREALDAEGIGDIVTHYKHGRSINRDRINCDYYQFLDGSSKGTAAYNGDYMTQYSWAEPTRARLEVLYEDRM